MTRIQLTDSGPTFSRIVAGVMRLHEWGMDTSALRAFIAECLDLGITTFDHADIYGSYTCEELFGRALAAEPSLRNRIELVTKCGIQLVSPNRPATRVHHYDTSRDHIIASAERSLRNLHTDTLDLLLVHRPDPLMDADEVAEALVALRRSGKIRHAGVSNFTPRQFELLQSRLDFPLVTNQIELSPLYLAPLHDGTLDQLQQWRVPPMVWSPVAGGRLFNADDERARRVREALEAVGREVGAPVGGVALAWLLRHPARVLPVMGTGKIERLREAVMAESIALDRQQWFIIWEASAGREVP
ncbi:MAG: aldo/keto reductase [Anaerolineae bacterium]|uniref:aldo/keto reductase n=1 Tax=Promineifilum sp. TaxID=2664178 RepID=UPI001DC1B905|nr:aldo/keto reductase [Anaerolineales bacterium]MCB8933994.1 aldo/keto reductase [Promineifilum sp.]MCO5179393.1 aldo/keto reductase [Promineifilum sp.]MCW5845891.1 aldo/keto reductase [Anaerolineae bacterium]